MHGDGLTRLPYASCTLESRCIRTLPTRVSCETRHYNSSHGPSLAACRRQFVLRTQMDYSDLNLGDMNETTSLRTAIASNPSRIARRA